MPIDAFEVPPRSRKELRQIADNVRTIFSVKTPYLDIARLVDVDLQNAWPEYIFEVCDEDELGDMHGSTFPDAGNIRIRLDVYEGAIAGKGRDRLTIAHELGHLILHANLGMARRLTDQTTLPAYKSSEWQANAFAAELLVSAQYADAVEGEEAAAEIFGVSEVAAEYQWNVWKKEGIKKN